jgi:NACHT domain
VLLVVFSAGSGKSVLWYVSSSHLSSKSFILSNSSSIIQDAKAKCDSGLALLGYFYFDFRDIAKQDVRGLLTSFLGQLSAKSDPCNHILSQLYSQHNAGSHQPDDQALTECLEKMLKLPGLPDVYIIVDGLDECPNTCGFPTARERVLDLVDELVQLGLPNLRVCVTSRPETDIRKVLERLTSLRVSLHGESGQGQDILDYISTVVHSDRRMQGWRTEDKQLVIDVLSARSDGM